MGQSSRWLKSSWLLLRSAGLGIDSGQPAIGEVAEVWLAVLSAVAVESRHAATGPRSKRSRHPDLDCCSHGGIAVARAKPSRAARGGNGDR